MMASSDGEEPPMTDHVVIKSPQAPASAGAAISAKPVSAKSAGGQDRNLAVGYLRAFITVLPRPSADFTKAPYTWGAFPIMDPHNSPLPGILTGFNETFFMSLMFF